MVKRVYKGIPLQLKGRAWALMLDVEKSKKENEGKYEVKTETMFFKHQDVREKQEEIRCRRRDVNTAWRRISYKSE